MLLTNPVVVSVLVMIALCLFNVNVVLALLLAALSAGIAAGMPLPTTMNTLIGGMSGNAETALSYFLLGTLAAAIHKTGAADIACRKIAVAVKGHKISLLLILTVISCLSQNVVPVHIAFIPILIPPLLGLFNSLRIDRRQIACALTFGLKAPYIALPIGFGLIFHGIIATEMSNNNVIIAKEAVFRYCWILGVSMVAGLLIALLFSYNKPRDYTDTNNEELGEASFSGKHWITFASVLVAFFVQLKFSSLPLGALAALVVMIACGAIKLKEIDETFEGGVRIMGLIAFVMLIAAGYGTVLRETESVLHLVNAVVGLVGGSKFWGAFLMLFVGLLVTMGIGTSFGTIPIIAAIYCPLGVGLGFSVGAITCLIAAAAALGDAGSPASDSTLGPTSGLNADGQHNHIWDTCLPTFIHYNIPLFIGGMIGALILF